MLLGCLQLCIKKICFSHTLHSASDNCGKAVDWIFKLLRRRFEGFALECVKTNSCKPVAGGYIVGVLS
jgi:hypothetical protein